MMGQPTRRDDCYRPDCGRERQPGEQFCSRLCRRIHEVVGAPPNATAYYPDMKQAAPRHAYRWLDVRAQDNT